MIETLQSLRIVFSLTVMLAHFSYAGIEGHSTGVGPMFFMLMTGVVMSRSYGPKIRSGNFRMRPYLLRRFFKFYPLHLLCLVAILLIRHKTLTSTDLLSILPNALLLQSWIPDANYYFSLNGVSWYLSDLLLFLLFFPFIYRWICKMGDKALRRTAILLFAGYVAYVSLVQTDDLNYWLYIFPPVRLLDFIWGMMIWRYYELHPTWGRFRRPTLVELLLAFLLVMTIVLYPLHERWHVALIHWIIMIPLVLVFMQGDQYGGWLSRFLKTRVMVWLGGLTLDTYLLHDLIFAILLNNASKYDVVLPYPLMLVACVGVVILVSWLTHRFFVNPVNERLNTWCQI